MTDNRVPLTILTARGSHHIIAAPPPISSNPLHWSCSKQGWAASWGPDCLAVTAVIKGHVQSLYGAWQLFVDPEDEPDSYASGL